jgi:flagellar biosynthesis/type III secretory pathway M-ring protein FliF/YscJ
MAKAYIKEKNKQKPEIQEDSDNIIRTPFGYYKKNKEDSDNIMRTPFGYYKSNDKKKTSGKSKDIGKEGLTSWWNKQNNATKIMLVVGCIFLGLVLVAIVQAIVALMPLIIIGFFAWLIIKLKKK